MQSTVVRGPPHVSTRYAPLRSEWPDFWNKFHVFYAIWSVDTLEFYLDDQEKATYTKRASAGVFIANASQKLILDLDVQPLDEDWLNNYDSESFFSVDFFNVYRKCKADETWQASPQTIV